MAFKVFISHSVAPKELGIVYAMAIRQQNERAGMAKCRGVGRKIRHQDPSKDPEKAGEIYGIPL